MKIRHIYLLLLVFTGVSPHVHAAVSEGTPIAAATLAPLAAWVTEATGVAIPTLPLAIASASKLKAAQNIGGVQNARAVAAYLPGRIMVNNILWDPDSVRAQSYLVHELVHHAQLISRRPYPCHAAKESEAYTLQNKWLAEHDQPPVVSAAWIARISSCGGNEADAD